MNITYVAPSFHPNQAPIMKGFVENGHQVTFISQFLGPTEDHFFCKPYILGYSKVFQVINSIYQFFTKRKQSKSAFPEGFRIKCGFPNHKKLKSLIVQSKPDIVIVRERSIYSMTVYKVCKRNHILCMLYNQSPLWSEEPVKNDFMHRYVKKRMPDIRMTPVLGNRQNGLRENNSYYIPFVIEPKMAPTDKKYFNDKKIKILCVGKYEPRKNQMMLLNVVKRLKEKYSLELTIVGEVSTPFHEEFLGKLKKFIKDNSMEPYVKLFINKKTSEMEQFYKDADLFILPSTGEFASVSQLEAMSFSLPVIVSDTNGTSCYVEEGINGYLFKDNQENDLEKKVERLITDRDNITKMGAKSYEFVQTKYSFKNYYEKINSIIENNSL